MEEAKKPSIKTCRRILRCNLEDDEIEEIRCTLEKLASLLVEEFFEMRGTDGEENE